MTYIKKLVMQGFKSFPQKTEVPFTQEINIIVGPNGGGKSNITDALCFVLGRLSIKSMRAAKSSNLIFLGTKTTSPSREASVEIIFDNINKTFSIDKNEISIKRIVRKNGQSIYKINEETKTRQEILALLAQAGIDPNGFNIILQNEIQNFVQMQNEERRKIIEEVSGISVYESRKLRSLKELEKTDEKLKQVSTILRERTNYLNRLEEERKQALKFKKIEGDIKKFKASIINAGLETRKKQRENILAEIDKKTKELEKLKSKIIAIQTSIKTFEENISSINSTIQESTGLEQEKLNQEIANIRAELAGTNVKLESYEKKLSELSKQKQELSELIKNNELSIKEFRKESPSIAKKQEELNAKKKELEILEKEKKKFYMIKSELSTIKGRFEDKQAVLQDYANESNFLLKQIEIFAGELYDSKTTKEKIDSLKQVLAQKKEIFENLNKREREIEKISFANEFEIDKTDKLIVTISKMDVCPVCKNKITKEHVHSIKGESALKLNSLKKQIGDSDKELKELYSKRELIKKEIENDGVELSRREIDLLKLININEKKNRIKVLQENIEKIREEIKGIEKRKRFLEAEFDRSSNIEKKYETAFIEVQEINLRNEENIDSEISFKQKELERSKISLKQVLRDEEDYREESAKIRAIIESKEGVLEKKRQQDSALNKKFQALIQKRDSYQAKIRQLERELSNENNFVHSKEQEINNFKIDKAKVEAEIENYETDFLEFEGVEIIRTNKETLVQKLNSAQEVLLKIGSVNLKSLEVYDSIKKEYDLVQEKADTITKEKESILKIIHEIDIKKKKTFLKTLNELNNIFSRNCSQVNSKDYVFLELENKKEPFEGGVGIIVKRGHGKYLDVSSLSGGEKTMIALSLIFAIQELSPYYFYILDEIDAALDKRNSERLAGLLKRYMQKGQYIVITHNDEIMLSANNLYGVSMHEGISKIVSTKV